MPCSPDRPGAWLLVVFLVPVTLVMHDFRAAPGAITFQIEQAMFVKNLTMLGGALLISYFGAGPLSLDAFISGERPFIDTVPRQIPQAAGK
jgi:uncharacterized membrane protein YphA (DoxX/SURF4 family)